MTTNMTLETPINGVNSNDVSEIINGIDNGICTIACVTSTTSLDAAGDYRITRRLECVRANKDVAASDRILDLEISGTQGTTPVVTLNGQVLPTTSVIVLANGSLEIRNLKGMLIDCVQLPVNANTPSGQFIPPMYTPYTTNAPTAFGTGTIGLVKKPCLGIAVRPVSSELAHHVAIDARNVCVVSDVIAGSPAFAAGIEPNDVILCINGKQANIATLRHELDAAQCGQVLCLVVLGKGIKRGINVLLEGNFASSCMTFPTQLAAPMPVQRSGSLL